MKKIKTRRILKLIIFICTILLSFNLTAYARDKSLRITDLFINMKIQENGAYNVDEEFVYKFNGRFNGVYRDISIKDLGKLENLNIYMFDNGQNIKFKLDNNAKKGDKHVYSIEKMNKDFIRIKIFMPCRDEIKKFKLIYTLSHGVTLYNDIGECYYNIWDKSYETKVDKIVYRVEFPNKFDMDDVKIYSRGVDDVFKGAIDDRTVRVNASEIGSTSYLCSRILFPKELVKSSYKIINKSVKKEIMGEEEEYLKMIKRKRQEKYRRRDIVNEISKVTLCIEIFLFILYIIKNKNKNRKKLEVVGLPEECTPAVAVAFCKMQNDISKTFISTILDLNRKGYIKIEKFFQAGKEDYKLTLLNEVPYKLLKHELFCLKVFNKYSDYTGILSMEEFKKKVEKKGVEFITDLNKWNYIIKEEVKKRGYFDKRKRRLGIVYCIFSFILFGFSIVEISITDTFLSVLNLVFSIVLFILSISLFYMLNYEARCENAKWINIKNEFSKGNFGEVTNKYPIDRYLPYMVAFGVSESVLGKFRIFIVNNNIYNDDNWISKYFLIDSMMKRNSFFMWSNSNFSSSSGFGGFSSGGGGGAGGGGAGGF